MRQENPFLFVKPVEGGFSIFRRAEPVPDGDWGQERITGAVFETAEEAMRNLSEIGEDGIGLGAGRASKFRISCGFTKGLE